MRDNPLTTKLTEKFGNSAHARWMIKTVLDAIMACLEEDGKCAYENFVTFYVRKMYNPPGSDPLYRAQLTMRPRQGTKEKIRQWSKKLNFRIEASASSAEKPEAASAGATSDPTPSIFDTNF